MEIAETNLIVLHEILEEGMARIAKPAVEVVLKDYHLPSVSVISTKMHASPPNSIAATLRQLLASPVIH
jgi:hypothetical protein